MIQEDILEGCEQYYISCFCEITMVFVLSLGRGAPIKFYERALSIMSERHVNKFVIIFGDTRKTENVIDGVVCRDTDYI